VPPAGWTLDAHGAHPGDAPGWRALTGQEPEAARGDGWLDAAHPEDALGLRRRWAEARADSLPLVCEARLRRAGGGHAPTLLRLVPVPSADGRGVREWVGVAEDAAPQRRDEADDLRRAAERLSLVARVTQSVVATEALPAQMRGIAEQVRAAFGVDACVIRSLEGDELVLTATAGVASEALFPSVRAGVGISRAIIDGRGPFAIRDVKEHPVTANLPNTPGGFHFRAYAGAPLLADGRVEGILGVYVVDGPREFSPTDLEHLQIFANYAAVARANDRLYRDLRAGEARFKAIFENAFDAVAVSEGGRLVYCNPAYVRMFGYPSQEAMLGLSALDLVAPVDRAAAAAQGAELAAGTATPGVNELRCRRADGSEFTVEGQASAFELDGRPYVAAVLRDISERKAAQERQAALLEQQQRIAHTLQRSLLIAPPEDAVPGLAVRPLYETALDEALVGGDFYDFYPLTDTQVALVVGDVAGKGLAAAAETVQIKFALRALLREHYRPDLALQRLNRFLMEAHPSESDGLRGLGLGGSLVALTVAVIDAETGLVTLATAGSEPAIFIHRRGGPGGAPSLDRVATDGLMLRADPDAEYGAVLFHLEPGDVLALMTDGITEARRGGTMFADTGLEETLLRAAQRDTPLEVMGQSLIDAAKFFAGGELRDDVCLVLARRRAPVPAVETRPARKSPLPQRDRRTVAPPAEPQMEKADADATSGAFEPVVASASAE
jgi:PAS domain S-box-containing protein